jgi:hypothetical protein
MPPPAGQARKPLVSSGAVGRTGREERRIKKGYPLTVPCTGLAVSPERGPRLRHQFDKAAIPHAGGKRPAPSQS